MCKIFKVYTNVMTWRGTTMFLLALMPLASNLGEESIHLFVVKEYPPPVLLASAFFYYTSS